MTTTDEICPLGEENQSQLNVQRDVLPQTLEDLNACNRGTSSRHFLSSIFSSLSDLSQFHQYCFSPNNALYSISHPSSSSVSDPGLSTPQFSFQFSTGPSPPSDLFNSSISHANNNDCNFHLSLIDTKLSVSTPNPNLSL